MTHFHIKVCGITRPADAVLAGKLGADMIGLIFYVNSERYISDSRAKAIINVLPPVVDPTGVFVDTPVSGILRTAETCGLSWVQLHGTYSQKEIVSIQSAGLKVIRAFAGSGPSLVSAGKASRADLIMVDNSRGTGKAFNPRAGSLRNLPNFVLTGAVSSVNVKAGVRAYRPLVIDVNSSVERSPGIKSREKLIRFFNVCNEIRYGK